MVHCISGKKKHGDRTISHYFFQNPNVPKFSENGDRTK